MLRASGPVSDVETKARTHYNSRWKAALGARIDEHPLAKSTLQSKILTSEYLIRRLFKRTLGPYPSLKGTWLPIGKSTGIAALQMPQTGPRLQHRG